MLKSPCNQHSQVDSVGHFESWSLFFALCFGASGVLAWGCVLSLYTQPSGGLGGMLSSMKSLGPTGLSPSTWPLLVSLFWCSGADLGTAFWTALFGGCLGCVKTLKGTRSKSQPIPLRSSHLSLTKSTGRKRTFEMRESHSFLFVPQDFRRVHHLEKSGGKHHIFAHVSCRSPRHTPPGGHRGNCSCNEKVIWV